MKTFDACETRMIGLLYAYALSLPRREPKILVGLLTGHITLNRHLTVMKIEEDPL